VEDVRRLQGALPAIELGPVLPALLELIVQLRQAGIAVSDRRAVKLQRAIAASALICERATAKVSDLWVLRHIWDTAEQVETLLAIVQETVGKDASPDRDHPRARAPETPHAEGLARDLEELALRCEEAGRGPLRAHLRDTLTRLSARLEWIPNPVQREALRGQVDALWEKLGVA
jgi:MoxR-like ATPase